MTMIEGKNYSQRGNRRLKSVHVSFEYDLVVAAWKLDSDDMLHIPETNSMKLTNTGTIDDVLSIH